MKRAFEQGYPGNLAIFRRGNKKKDETGINWFRLSKI